MSKKGYLTSAEYRAMRILLGFSQQEAAEFHKVQNIRTIQRWEKGTSFVSELACDKITNLYTLINSQIKEAVKQALSHKQKIFSVVLIIYPDSCYKKYVFGIGDLPNNVHRTMIIRLYNALKGQNIDCGIVEFNPQDYFIYLGSHGLQDSHESRSMWAVDYRRRILH